MNPSRKCPHCCPICGKYEFSSWNSYDICPECGWEDDFMQEETPDDDLGANGISLNEVRQAYSDEREIE